MKPQPIVEAEAIAYARKRIADWRTNGVRGVLGLKERVLVFDKNENRQIFKAFIKMTALNPDGLKARVEEARRDVEVDDEVVRELIVEFLEHGEPLPKLLAEYNIELLRSGKAVRRSIPGPRHYDYHQRDLAIYFLAVDIVNGFKLKPTRSSAQRPCACSIISSALKQEGVGMDEQAVVAIWKRFTPPPLPPTPKIARA